MTYLNKQQIEALRKVKLIIRILDHPDRQRILKTISSNGNYLKAAIVYEKLGIDYRVAWQHFLILRRHGLLTFNKQGNARWYSVNHRKIKIVVNATIKAAAASK